jgi:putative ABC transport system permease protein
MIRFLFKGLMRDRSRSLFPLLTVFAGVMLTVCLHSWLSGSVSSLIQSTAHYSTGHVRVLTRAYAKEAAQNPNDLALLGIDTLIGELSSRYRDLLWTPRIQFGGLLDVPDAKGETRAQSPVSGLAIDLLHPESPEWKVFDVRQSLVRGHEPRKEGEILLGDELALKLRIGPGDTATLITSTMYGSMSITNFVVAGTVRFGIAAMDKGTVIADLSDAQRALDMQNGAGEILGFFGDDLYHEERAKEVTADFNTLHAVHAGTPPETGSFLPVMGTLRTESGMSDYLDYIDVFSGVIVAVFVIAMSVVLWNAGLTGSLRRYGEIGIRLAIGEDKTHVYFSLLAESIMIGFIGSILGTAIGLAVAWYGEVHGLDLGAVLKDSSMLFPNVVRARITPVTYLIGFLPGLLATFLGTAISGIGIYRRQTSELFKELAS